MSIDHSSPYNSLAGKRTYTVEEIAKILGIGRTAAYSLVHSGVFKAVRIGSSIRVSKVSFDDWLDKQNRCGVEGAGNPRVYPAHTASG